MLLDLLIYLFVYLLFLRNKCIDVRTSNIKCVDIDLLMLKSHIIAMIQIWTVLQLQFHQKCTDPLMGTEGAPNPQVNRRIRSLLIAQEVPFGQHVDQCSRMATATKRTGGSRGPQGITSCEGLTSSDPRAND